MIKKVIGFIGIVAFAFLVSGCEDRRAKYETKENKAFHHKWYLEYYSKVNIGDETLYNCVYGRYVGYRDGVAFSILSNEKCKEILDN